MSDAEVLKCNRCGKDFERRCKTGKRPKNCPPCSLIVIQAQRKRANERFYQRTFHPNTVNTP